MNKDYCYHCKCEVGEFNKDNPYIMLSSSRHVYICFSCAKNNMPQELFNFLTAPLNNKETKILPIPVRVYTPTEDVKIGIDWGSDSSYTTFIKLSTAAFDTGSLGLR